MIIGVEFRGAAAFGFDHTVISPNQVRNFEIITFEENGIEYVASMICVETGAFTKVPPYLHLADAANYIQSAFGQEARVVAQATLN